MSARPVCSLSMKHDGPLRDWGWDAWCDCGWKASDDVVLAGSHKEMRRAWYRHRESVRVGPDTGSET